MLLPVVPVVPLGVGAASLSAGEPALDSRPITEADSVLAVYRTDLGFPARGGTSVVLVAWPDGQVVWSSDRLKGGDPYWTGRVGAKRVADLLTRFEADGLFGHAEVDDSHLGPHSAFLTVLVKLGKEQVKLETGAA